MIYIFELRPHPVNSHHEDYHIFLKKPNLYLYLYMPLLLGWGVDPKIKLVLSLCFCHPMHLHCLIHPKKPKVISQYTLVYLN